MNYVLVIIAGLLLAFLLAHALFGRAILHPPLARWRGRAAAERAAGRLRELQHFEALLDLPPEQLAKPLAALPGGDERLLAVAIRPEAVTFWERLGEEPFVATDPSERLRLADELTIRGLAPPAVDVPGPGLRGEVEQAIRRAEAGQGIGAAYQLWQAAEAELPAVSRQILARRLGKAAADRELSERQRERAASEPVMDDPPACFGAAWDQLERSWAGSWRPAETPSQQRWEDGGPVATAPERLTGEAPVEGRLSVLRGALRNLASRMHPPYELEPGSRYRLDPFDPEPVAAAFLLAARPSAGSGAEPWRALLAALDEPRLAPAGALAAITLLNLLRSEFVDPGSPLRDQFDEADFVRHWTVLGRIWRQTHEQTAQRRCAERLRCVACYSLLPQVREAAEARLARWAVSRPEGYAAAAFCTLATPFLLHAADRLPEAPALIDRVLRHVWLQDPEPARGDAYVNLRTTLHRLPVDLRPPEDWAWRGVPRDHVALVEKATELVLRESLARARERCVQRCRAATEQALREWAIRVAGG